MTTEYTFWMEEFQHRKLSDYEFLYQCNKNYDF